MGKNINLNATERNIGEYFESLSYRVHSVCLIHDRIRNKSKVCIEFSDVNTAQNVISNMKELELYGRKLEISLYNQEIDFEHENFIDRNIKKIKKKLNKIFLTFHSC